MSKFKYALKIFGIIILVLVATPFVFQAAAKSLPDCKITHGDFAGRDTIIQTCSCIGYEFDWSHMHSTNSKCIGYASDVKIN